MRHASRLLLALVATSATSMTAPVCADEPAPGSGASASAASAAASAAASSNEDARRLFLAGRQAYQAGRLDVAASSFEASYKLSPLPGLLFNLGRVYQKQFLVTHELPSLVRAVDDYRRYLAAAPEGPNRETATQALWELTPLLARLQPEALAAPPTSVRSDDRAATPSARTQVMVLTEAEGATVSLDGRPSAPAPLLADVEPGSHRATVEARGYASTTLALDAQPGRMAVGEARLVALPGQLRVGGEAGAGVSVDGRAVGRLPLLPVQLPAGVHTVAVGARGRSPFTRSIEVPRGAEVSVDALLLPTLQRRLVPWWLVGAGAALAVAGICTAVSLDADGTAADLLARQQSATITVDERDAYYAARSRRDDARTAGFASLGAAVVLAVVATVLYLADTPSALAP